MVWSNDKKNRGRCSAPGVTFYFFPMLLWVGGRVDGAACAVFPEHAPNNSNQIPKHDFAERGAYFAGGESTHLAVQV